MSFEMFGGWPATRCPHCGVVPPRWLRFERCDDPPCLVCCGDEDAGYGWYLTSSPTSAPWWHVARCDDRVHVVHVCSACKEAVS